MVRNILKRIESNRGDRRDLTQGSIVRNIWLLAVPMSMEMTVHDVDHLFDLFWLGRLGPAAIAAVAMCETILIVVSSVGIGLQLGVRAMVARRIGERNFEGANNAALQALLLALASSLVLGTIGFLIAQPALRLLGAQPEVVSLGTGYLRISFLGLFARVSFFVVNAALRGAGSAVAAMWILGIVSFVNIIIDPLLIFGVGPLPKLGVLGSALAVVLSRTMGLVVQFCILLTRRARIGIERRQLRIDLDTMREVIGIGFPGTARTIFERVGTLILVKVVALYGTFALAAYGIARRIYWLAQLPSLGLSSASATLVGQNLGAGQSHRSERSAWLAVGHNMVISGTVGVVFFALAAPLVSIFNSAPQVVQIGSDGVRIIALSYVFVALAMVLAESLNGAGDTLPPMVINASTLWVIQLPLAYLLSAKAGWDVRGIWTAIAATNVSNAFLLAAWFKRGRWKLKAV